MKDYSISDAQNYAWQHFSHHANHRLMIFNFYILLSSLSMSVGATLVAKDSPLYSVSAILFLLVSILAYVFWRLDQRVKGLFQDSAEVLKQLEIQISESKKDIDLKIFSRSSSLKGRTYSDSFFTIFIILGFLGFIGTLLSIYLWFQ